MKQYEHITPYSTGYKIKARHTSICISNYTLGDCEKLERYLSIWNEGYYRFEPLGYIYHEDKKELLIPRGIDINYVEKLLNSTSDVEYTPDPYDTISVKLKSMPRNNIQKKSIAFLIGENDFKYTKKYSQLLLNLAPGDGKTYISTAALTFYGMKAIVITHTDKIKNQWYETLTKMTDLDDTQICNIEGSTVINKLVKKDNLKFKVYLVHHSTISSYAKKNGWDSIGELFKHLKVGVKIYDEAHLNFANIIKIDLSTNTKKTIYLTATFERTNKNEIRLFNICFRNLIRYGSETKKEKRKHIFYIGVLYNSKPPLDTQAYMHTFKGFNKIRYSTYQMGCQKFYDALDHIMGFFNDKEGKIMILSSKIDATEAIKNFLKDKIDDKTIASYHSKISDEDKEKALIADIICTTPQSAGTGFDLPGLRTVIMTESYSSKVEAEQVSGRLREYSDTDNTFYVELVDTGFKRVYDMYRQRMKVFKTKCAKMLFIDLKDKI